MTRKLSVLLPWVALLATGCTPVLSDLVLFTVNDGGVVSVDTICASPCPGDDVPVEVAFAEALGVDAAAELDLRQYRVDYAISGSDAALDYHSDTLSVLVSTGQTSTFAVDMAASSQRTALDILYADGFDSAVATVTFSGYDQRDELLDLSVDVPVLFGRLDARGTGGTLTSTGTGTGTSTADTGVTQ